MPIRSKSHSAAAMILLGLTGCAAPIKALINEPAAPAVDRAVLKAADQQEVELRAALVEKGKLLLNSRVQATGGGSSAPKVVRVADKSATLSATHPAANIASPAVSAMLARAKSSQSPQPAATALEASGLTKSFRVKDETRLKDSPNGSLEKRPDQLVIRFEAGVTSLDAEGNRALADLARRSELAPSATIVLVAGLSGRGTPWERMQAASERLEVVARHVPPPLRVERRFELELENHHLRLELHREIR